MWLADPPIDVLASYLRTMGPFPREMESIFTRAYWVAELLGSKAAQNELEIVFRGVAP